MHTAIYTDKYLEEDEKMEESMHEAKVEAGRNSYIK